MIVKILQQEVGQFNWIGTEKTFVFKMGIVENPKDRETIELEGFKAILVFRGEPNEADEFENAIENIGEIFHKCFDYAGKQSGEYTKQCIAFLKLYRDNYEAIDGEMLKMKNERIQNEIEKLSKKLLLKSVNDPIDEYADLAIESKISSNKKMIDYYNKQLSEYREDSTKYAEAKKQIEKYETFNLNLKTFLSTYEPATAA